MKSLKYSEILARNSDLEKSMSGKPYRVALLSNVVVNQLKEILEFVLRERGINAYVICGDYDNIVQDSMRFRDVDATVIFWETANLTEGLHATAEALNPEDLDAIVERVEREMEMVFESVKDIPLVLFNRFSALQFTMDELRPGVLQQISSRLNTHLDRLMPSHQIAVNLDSVLAQVGLNASADFRQFQSSKALYTLDFLKSYAEYVAPAFLSVTGKMRKLLVLDCDNTLWGGVLGEDGERQIQMNDSNRVGRIFREVQQTLSGFRKRGVLLALCSKNNPADVDQVLAEHPDMILRGNDFVAKKINWQDKATNIRQLAQDLNLGLDSIVFVDDSPFEIGLVKDELPQVACVTVPDSLSDYPATVRRLAREFFALSATSEDLRKTEMYQEEQARDGAKAKYSNLDEYLQSLELRVCVSWNSGVLVSRAAQLTQKTNQFNLTTNRYTEADIERMLSNKNFLVASFTVADRYGDYGIVGLLILELADGGREGRVDTFLMSCRVIGRNVEKAVFDHLVLRLREMGVDKLCAEYRRTLKNDQVSGFYPSLGFNTVMAEPDLSKYYLVLADYRQSGIDYIEVMEDAC